MENTTTDIGTLLKDQREKLGYSLQEAAQQTCIRKTYLESIENNQFSDLPGRVYVTGFIKVYARYLGVENARLLKLLEELRLTDRAASVHSINVVKHQIQRFGKPSPGVVWSAYLIGFLAVLIIGGAIYLLAPMFQDKGTAELTSNQAAPAKPPVKEPVGASAGAAGETAGEARETAQDVAVSPAAAESPPVVAEAASPVRAALPKVAPAGSSLRMLALSEGSLIIDVDDRESQSYKLHDGLDLTWKVKRMVRVELAGPGTARFWLDGQELELGDLGSFLLQPVTGD